MFIIWLVNLCMDEEFYGFVYRICLQQGLCFFFGVQYMIGKGMGKVVNNLILYCGMG